MARTNPTSQKGTVSAKVKKQTFEPEKHGNKEKMNLPNYTSGNPFIFVSYSHSDTSRIRPILSLVYENKYRFWYDETMEIGEDFRKELEEQIERSKAVLFFMSKASLSSKYCCMEIINAYKYNKKIYPVKLDPEVEIPSALKMILDNTQQTDASEFSEKSPAIQKLLSCLPFETKRNLVSNNKVITKCEDGSKNVTINPGLIAIGEAAFKEVNTLESINLANDGDMEDLRKESFRGCKNLKELDVPQSVKHIGESAFRDCSGMLSLRIENPNIEIGERAFENCSSLVDIELPEKLTEIYGGVFNSCKSLSTIKLPRDLTVLSENCFADCVKLEKIEIPEKVSKIDDMAFSGCVGLKEIEFPTASLTKLGKNVFKDCGSLTSISLPLSLTSIGSGPFRGCSKLFEINVHKDNRYYKSVDGILFNKNKSVLISYPASKDTDPTYTIPDSVLTISDWAFCGCNKINQIIIQDSVTEIGEGAFYKCTQLETVEIPNSVTKIDDTAFRGCTALKQIIIPNSVKEFGWGVFSGCSSELKVICDSDSCAAKYCEKNNIQHDCR